MQGHRLRFGAEELTLPAILSGRILLPVLASLFLLMGCTTWVAHQPISAQESAGAAPQPTDAPKLSQFINLPVQPAQELWQVREKGARGDAIGPTDIELVAVLQLEQGVIQELQGQLVQQTTPSDLFVARDFVQPWFPDVVQQRFVADSADSEYLKLTGVRYQPTLFAKGSLNNGYVVIADSYVFVYLHST